MAALAYWARLDPLNFNVDAHSMSNLVGDGADTEILHFAIQANDAAGTNPNLQEVYYRNINTSTGVLSTPVSVSGPLNAFGQVGAWMPSLVRLNDGTLIVGYELNPVSGSGFKGFTIKESTDGGLNWGSAFGPGPYTTDSFFGLYRNEQGLVIALTKAPTSSGATMRIHVRSGAGSWVTRTIWGGSSSNYWNLRNRPQNSMVVQGNTAVIVGGHANSTNEFKASALVSSNLVTFSEIALPLHTAVAGSTGQYQAQIKMGVDRRLRAIYRYQVAVGSTEHTLGLALSADVGKTWIAIAEPTAFRGNDASAAAIVWGTQNQDDTIAFALDRGDQWWINTPQGNLATKLHTFRGIADTTSAFSYVDSPTPNTGGANLNWSGVSRWSAPAVFSGTDYYRAVATWNSVTGRAEMWLLRTTGVGTGPAHAGSGGGGDPKTYPD
jgi:hypothetical protein